MNRFDKVLQFIMNHVVPPIVLLSAFIAFSDDRTLAWICLITYMIMRQNQLNYERLKEGEK